MLAVLRLTVYLIIAFIVVACGDSRDTGSPADALLADADAVSRGRSLFVGTCAGYCHKLTPERVDAVYLFDCEWKHGGSDREIFNTVTNGVPNTRMVGFGTNFPEGESDLWRIIAFLKSNRDSCA
ncbi:MAG: cytochrome c [Pseudomonadota bacterium]|nr:cytochrome c [Pseudomonadota bacterium]